MKYPTFNNFYQPGPIYDFKSSKFYIDNKLLIEFLMEKANDRHFPNQYSDYNNQPVEQLIKADFWKKWICETGLQCMHNLKAKQSSKYCDGGLYVGNLGLIFMALKMSKSKYFPEHEETFKKYMNECLAANENFYLTHQLREADKTAFLLGKGGLISMGILATKYMGVDFSADMYTKDYAHLSPTLQKIDFLPKGSDELFVGRAGYLAGHLIVKKYLNIGVLPKADIFSICNAIVQSGRNYARKYNTASPLMYAYHGTEYLGAGHGLAGILQILLSFPEYLSANPDVEKDVKNAVDFYFTIQKSNGNFPIAMDPDTHKAPRNECKDLLHWCHGGGGIIYLLAKAYLHWKEPKYLEACKKLNDVIWENGLLKKGPGICHGIAGNGFTHLILYRLTNDNKYLYRAAKFADFLLTDTFKSGARTPDSPFSLFEGLAGTVCFIIDLLDPKHAEYPLLPIF